MSRNNRRPDKIIRAGGREFKLYEQYDDLAGRDILIYPDFAESPEYTAEGRPFTTAAEEGCVCGKPRNPEDAEPDDYSTYGDCGGCVHFHREEPYAIIGVCMCEERKQKNMEEESNNENK